VEAQVFADFSARLGITNIREYEQTALRKHQDLLQQQAVVTKQSAALSSQLAYELKRDFQGSLDRLAVQMGDAAKENDVLLALEQSLLHEEIKIRGLVKEANDKVNKLRHAKDELHQALKTAQIRRAEVLKDKESVTKKLAGEEILIERGRTQLHEILQKARTDEIALPTVNGAGDEETGKAGNAGKSSARGEGVVRGRDSEDLRWEGTQPQSLPQRQSASGRRGEGTQIVMSSITILLWW
jgi:structural maintenance of chromosome 1